MSEVAICEGIEGSDFRFTWEDQANSVILYIWHSRQIYYEWDSAARSFEEIEVLQIWYLHTNWRLHLWQRSLIKAKQECEAFWKLLPRAVWHIGFTERDYYPIENVKEELW